MGSRNIVYLSDFFSKRAVDRWRRLRLIPYHFVRDDLDAGTLTLLGREQPMDLSSTVDRLEA